MYKVDKVTIQKAIKLIKGNPSLKYYEALEIARGKGDVDNGHDEHNCSDGCNGSHYQETQEDAK